MTRSTYIFSIAFLLIGLFTSPVFAAGADINNDGIVNVQDLGIMLSNWSATGSNIADINGDNLINVQDLGIMLSSWGASIPPPSPPPPPSGVEIQRALFNDWSIQGNTSGFENGGGGVPGGTHSVGGGTYTFAMTSGNAGDFTFYNFPGQATYGQVMLSFDIRITGAIDAQLKGWRFRSGTALSPSGTGLGGLFFGPINGGSGLYFVFEGFGMGLNTATGAYFGASGGQAIANNIGDGRWHTIEFTYDVASTQRRMRLVVGGTLIAPPDGTGGVVFGQPEGCSGQFGSAAATWQGGWLVACTAQPGTVIGSGTFFDSYHAGGGAPIEIRNMIWTDAS